MAGTPPLLPRFKPLEPDDPRLTLDYFRDHRDEWRELCLKVRTKAEGLQPFRRNHTQRVFAKKIADLRAAGIPPRLLVLKSRQVGISTETESELFEDIYFNAHRTALVLAHNERAAKGLLRMSRLFYEGMPLELRKAVGTDLKNVRELELVNGSRMQVEAVGEVRSYSAQSVHFSEFAFYENPVETLIAVMQSVPASTNSLAVIESTANGVGNKFHEMWVRAIRSEGDAGQHPADRGWVPLFIPWFEHEEYTRRPNFLPSDCTREERDLAHRFKLRMGQIAWRRWCISVNCDGDEEKFAVEYPSSWQEAFALSGRPVFDARSLQIYRSRVDPDNEVEREKTLHHKTPACEVSWDAEKRQAVFDHVSTGGWAPNNTSGGRLRIYQKVNPRHTYIIGADPSEGDPKSDPSPLEVLDQMTLEQVAEWWGRTPPDMLAEFAAWLGWYYNTALIIGEANNQGISFHDQLLRMEYPNIYFRPVNEETVAAEVTKKPGWWETNKAKHALFDTGRKAIREQKLVIYSPGLLSEFETAIYDRKEGFTKTKIKPQPGSHIDRCIAMLMALYGHRGDVHVPLLPLPEADLVSAYERIAMVRDRDVERAEAMSLDFTQMTLKDLDRQLEAMHQNKMRREAGGFSTER